MTTLFDREHFGAGKRVFARLYCHVSSVPQQSAAVQTIVQSAAEVANVSPGIDFNVVRLDLHTELVGLLQYPHFFDEPFPILRKSWKVDLKANRFSVRIYEDSLNPPILHRKELMLSDDHPIRADFADLTRELEQIGLFNDPVRIGFKRQWEKLLFDSGFRVVGHRLVPIGNDEDDPDPQGDRGEPFEIARHLTALSRHSFSAPIQILKRNGFLDGSRTIFDYGCGKGDDIIGLTASGIEASGWDPHYAPKAAISDATIVNLGFVINVIEDLVERREALLRAFGLANELLVVSTMIASESRGNATLFGDGVITRRSTFQKYYTQSELREYLAVTLCADPIPVAPGIFFVFKDKGTEQRYLISRHRSRVRSSTPQQRKVAHPKSRARSTLQKERDPFAQHHELLDELWAQCLDLGREPNISEIANRETIEQALGSARKALRICISRNDLNLLGRARNQRKDDLTVYLALQQFQKRKPYKQLEDRLQNDVRAFFGDYRSAHAYAREVLFQAAKPELLNAASEAAAEQGLGWFEPSHSLQLHTSLVQRLPSLLRVYIGCAAVLYGDVSEADLVKIHIRSGKVSFLKFDKFFESPLPRLSQRTKINLRTLELKLFEYKGEVAGPLIYLKSRYLNEELPRYAEQAAFDEQLLALKFLDLSDYGPTEQELTQMLKRTCWHIEGFKLQRHHVAPGLDDSCGEYFTYRQLIECGETQGSTGISNLPENLESYAALEDLVTHILDPVVEYFGGIELTYGFCSGALAKRIPGRNAPKLDQHAALEKGRTGKLICPRLGAAVDFIVRDEDMRGVADWIIANLPFDRLYYYGADHPLHVSYGPENRRDAIQMNLTAKGSRVPHPYK